MTRNLLFHRSKDDAATFANDDIAPSLPLPTLENTLDKYFESIRPFGTAKELEKSKKIIDDFKNGIGNTLHTILLQKAKVEKNWVCYFLHCLIIKILFIYKILQLEHKYLFI